MTGRALAALTAGLACLTSLQSLHAQGDTIEVVIAVEITNGPRHVVLARAVDDRLLLPLQLILDQARVRVTAVVPGHRLEAVVEPEGRLILFDTDRGTLSGLRGTAALRPDSAVWIENQLFVVLGALQIALDVRASVDWSNLVVRLDQAEHLPVVRMAALARRRTAPAAPLAPPPLLSLPRAQLLDGAALDWSYATPTVDLVATSTMAAGLGATLVGGSLVARQFIATTGGSVTGRTDASWERAWASGPVRRVQVGDIGTGVLRQQTVRGAFVSNAPFVRPAHFATQRLDLLLPPGWSVEVYSAGTLTAVADVPPDGRVPDIALPLRYGSNPVELVLLGPFGEREVRRSETFIPATRLPAGRFEYAVGGGACRLGPCDLAGSLDLRYAPASRLTIQGGMEAFWRDTLPNLLHPYGRVAAAPHRSTSVTITAAWHALLSADVVVAPSSDFQFAAAGSLFDRNLEAPLLQPVGANRQLEGSVFWRPPLPGRRVFLRVSGSRASGLVDRTTAAGALGVRLAGAQITGDVLLSDVMTATGVPVRTRLGRVGFSRNLPGPGWFRRVFLSGSAQVTGSGLDAVRLGMSRQLRPFLRGQLAATWTAASGPGLGMTFSTVLPGLRATNAVDITADGALGGLQSLEGSVLWDTRTGHVRLGSGRALGLAGVTGDVYLDANANGMRDDDEEGIPFVSLAIGGRRALTDERGQYRLWELTPFEVTALSLDTLSLENPLLVPVIVSGSFHPLPNAFRRVNLPLVAGAEVSGTVRWDGTREAGGVTVELLDAESRVRYRATTFADGSYYLLGVAPGVWTLRVRPDVLDVLAATATTVTITVPMSGTGATILDADVVLTRR